jgi:3-hydroxymyristoyl/3-hydroxydecanoyl-(acyl carrier protein) dehydratase
MIETAAQLSAYAFLARIQKPSIVLFLRIEDAAFRSAMVPGDTLYILCQEQKSGRRRFITNVQGLIGGPDGRLSGKIAFDAVLNGMMVESDAY